MTSLATKTTITKSRAGHYWVRVRSECMPDIFRGDAYPDKLSAVQSVKTHREQVRQAVIAETLRMNNNASNPPTFTD